MKCAVLTFSLCPLSVSPFRRAGICQAGSRVFIFDYGGTLLHKEKYDIYIKRQTLSAIAGRKPSGKRMRFQFVCFVHHVGCGKRMCSLRLQSDIKICC